MKHKEMKSINFYGKGDIHVIKNIISDWKINGVISINPLEFIDGHFTLSGFSVKIILDKNDNDGENNVYEYVRDLMKKHKIYNIYFENKTLIHIIE